MFEIQYIAHSTPRWSFRKHDQRNKEIVASDSRRTSSDVERDNNCVRENEMPR